MSAEVSSSLNITVPDLSGLSAEEKEQVLNVMKKAREFEAQEEMNLMLGHRSCGMLFWQPLEGQLYKYTNVMKGWQYRWFVLEPNKGRLDYYEKEELKCQKPRGSVHLAGAVISPSDEDSQTFTVNAANGEIYRLRAIDAKERQHWVNRLRATAEHHTETMVQASPQLRPLITVPRVAVNQNLLPFAKDSKATVFNSPNQLAPHVLEKTNSGSLDSLQSTNKHRAHNKGKSSTLPNMSKSSPQLCSHSKISIHNSPKAKNSKAFRTGAIDHSSPDAAISCNSHGQGRSARLPGERSAVVVLRRSHHKHTYSSSANHQGSVQSLPVPAQVITGSVSDDCFRNVQDMLEQVQREQNMLINNIEELPTSGEPINSLDKEMLLLKATSSATLASLEQCLNILLQHQTVVNQTVSLSCYTPPNIDWLDPKPLQLSFPVANKHALPDPASPADSFVSASDVITDNYMTHGVSSATTECPSLDDDSQIEDAEEYTDTELGAVEEHKSVILHLLSQLKLGMDLTKVVLPTFILEKRSLLELFADCMAHPDLFICIPDEPDPESRMLAVVIWYLTSFHAGRKGSIAKKPYNPIIGETFQCSWHIPESFKSVEPQVRSRSPATSDTEEDRKENSPRKSAEQTGTLSHDIHVTGEVSAEENTRQNSEKNCTRLMYCAEQVSHHPPVSAFYFECPQKRIYMNASIWTKSKFMGMSIGVVMVGKVKLNLVDLEEEYEFSLPSAYARSILTVPWVELGDKITINCQKTGYSASVIFHTKPFYGGKLHRVTSEVKNPAGEVICKVTGEWNGVLDFTYADGRTKTIDTTEMRGLRKRVRPLSAQSEFESRRLWQHVTENLKKGDIDTATQHKRFLEERQRRGERHRKENNIPFPTKYFHKEGDSWVYNNPLKPTMKSDSPC